MNRSIKKYDIVNSKTGIEMTKKLIATLNNYVLSNMLVQYYNNDIKLRNFTFLFDIKSNLIQKLLFAEMGKDPLWMPRVAWA